MTAQQTIKKKEALAGLIKQARYEPCWFMREVLNIKSNEIDQKRGINWDLDLWQEELIEAVADVWRHKNGIKTRYNHEGKNKISVRAMHGPGKTFGAAAVMHLFNFVWPGLIVCTAPKEKQLKTRLWPTFRRIKSRANPEYQSLMKVDTLKIVWCNDEDWVAHGETASTPENLAGYHADYMLFVIDEASGVKEEMFPVIEGAISTGVIVIILMIGNPTKNTGTFYDSHRNPKVSDNYYQIHVDLNKTTRVSRQWVMEMEQKYGKDSPVVKVRCYGDFADMDENQLFALQWLYDAKGGDTESDGSHPTLVISVDVADGGIDNSVITIGEEYDSFHLIKKQLEYNWPPAISIVICADKAEELFYAYGGVKGKDYFVIDSLGVGSGTAGTLLKRGHNVVIYKGGEGSDDISRWKNRRTQSHICARDALFEKRVKFEEDFTDDWDGFCAQMCSIKTVPGNERTEELVTKEKMKKDGIKSPDKAESFIMQYATQTPTNMNGISVPMLFGHMESSNYAS